MDGFSLLTLWSAIAAPVTGTIFYLINKQNQKRVAELAVDSICKDIIKAQFRLIKKSKGNQIPTLQNIQMQLWAKLEKNKLNHKYLSKVGVILLGILDQVSSSENFPKQRQVIQKLEELINDWYNDNSPSPPHRGFFRKLKEGFKLLYSNTKSSKKEVLDKLEKNTIKRIESLILFNLNYSFIIKSITTLILIELFLLFLLKTLVPSIDFSAFVLINSLFIIYLHNRRITAFIYEYVIKRLINKQKIRKELVIESIKEKYEVKNESIFLENNDVLLFSDRRKYLKYHKVLLIKDTNLIKAVFSIISNYKLIINLEKDSKIIIRNKYLNFLNILITIFRK